MSVKRIVWGTIILAVYLQAQAQPFRTPQITQQPSSDTVVAGAPAAFTVVATGTGLTYQWQKNNISITGATRATYTIASTVAADAGLYRVIVSNMFGRDTSNGATLVIATTPVIVMHPHDTFAVAGRTAAVFRVTASGTGPLSYQWQKNSVNISGATGTMLTINPAQASDSGLYRVIVSNDWGSAISDRAKLTVYLPPQIIDIPHDTTVRQGQTAVFTVAATGTAPLTYLWQKDGAAIAGARTATLTITSAQLRDSGNYRVIVSNTYGRDTSAYAVFKVLPPNQSQTSPPQIVVQPRDTAVALGGTASFLVAVVSYSSVTYQWEKDGVRIQGAQGSSYTVGPVIAQDAGKYRVIVANQYGRDTSNLVTLLVGTGPTITQQPAAASVEEGGTVGFSVVATGTAPIAYQWQKNGTDISGATSSTFKIASAAFADSGTYRVLVSNPFGSVTSSGASLTVKAKPPAGQKPVVTGSPASKTAIVGDTVTFTVIASGTAPLSYQWQKNGVNIANAQSSSLTLSGVALADSGAYRVIVSNTSGTATSDNALLRVLQKSVGQEKPVITQHPSSQTVQVGNAAVFTVTATGARPFTYQWQKNGVKITGAADSVYTIGATAFADSGVYRVIVSNSLGADTSTNATLTITPKPVAGDAPVIRSHPSAQNAYAGDTVTFTVTATGTAPLAYQWQKNGVNIANALSANLTIAPAALSDSGVYRVVVTNSFGSATSNGALLSVTNKPIVGTKPKVTASPSSKSALAGTSVSFSVTATGTAPLYYQWQKNGADISNAQSATYAIASAALADSGVYRVVVFNSMGADTSAGATLQILLNPVGQDKPVILQHPASLSVIVGDTVSLSVSAAGAQPLSFQWQKNGANKTGATDSVLTFAPVAFSDSGTYRVIVSNSIGVAVSVNAIIVVNPKPVIITGTKPVIREHPASKTAVVGDSSVTFTVTATGTAPLTYQWQKNGVVIAGQTSASLRIAPVTMADSGGYRVTVSNSYGSETSFEARLSVYQPPLIMNNPASQTVLAGSAVTFTVIASGSPQLTYQWQKNGVAVAGGDAASFTIASASISDSGTYRVMVANAWGTATSEAANLSVSQTSIAGKIPVITRQPSSQTVAAGDSAIFSVAAVCTEQMSYQWKKNDANISGATSAILRFAAATAQDAASYSVVVSSKYGNAASNRASLTVLLPTITGQKPVISRDPASITASRGDTVRFSVSTSGTAPLRFQWQKNGVDIAGANDSLFRIDSARAADAATYSVVVSNAWGSDTSKNATLTIKNAGPSASPVVYWDHNPVHSSVGAHFTVDIPDTGKATACIADMAGDMVYSLIGKGTSFNPGVYQISWSGQSVKSPFAGTGTYVYVFTYTRKSSGKTTVIRKPIFLVK